MFTLETPRLILRDFLPTDFEALIAATQHPAYGRFYPEEETTQEHWEMVFNRILNGAQKKERQMFQTAICSPVGTLIGTVGIRIEDAANQQASYGCAIAQPYWGQGYAYEASHAMIDYGFTHLPIHRLYAETISENAQACALAQRLRMRREATLRKNRFFRGQHWDTAIYAVLKKQWDK